MAPSQVSHGQCRLASPNPPGVSQEPLRAWLLPIGGETGVRRQLVLCIKGELSFVSSSRVLVSVSLLVGSLLNPLSWDHIL
jgi:hypothetical protein